MQAGEHLLFAALVLVGLVQALVRELPVLPVVAVSLGLAGCYLVGVVLGARLTVRSRHGWLFALTAVWIAAILVSPTFAWLAFALFFLYLYYFPMAVALPVVMLLAVVVVVVLLVRENGNPAATVIGPLLGAAVAIVIMRIYQDLIRRERPAQARRRAA